MEMIGTLIIRLRVIANERARYITLHKCIARRQDCDDELQTFFTENPGVERAECAMEWVYRDCL